MVLRQPLCRPGCRWRRAVPQSPRQFHPAGATDRYRSSEISRFLNPSGQTFALIWPATWGSAKAFCAARCRKPGESTTLTLELLRGHDRMIKFRLQFRLNGNRKVQSGRRFPSNHPGCAAHSQQPGREVGAIHKPATLLQFCTVTENAIPKIWLQEFAAVR